MSPPVRGVGLWEVSTDLSKIDDSTSVTALLTASQPIGAGYKQAIPTAVARCKEGDLDFYIVWGMFIGSSKHPVTMRLDSDDAGIENWSVSTDHKATFYSGNVNVLFEALTKAKKLVVRTTPYGESPVITSFDISGFSNVHPAILKACGLWALALTGKPKALKRMANRNQRRFLTSQLHLSRRSRASMYGDLCSPGFPLVVAGNDGFPVPVKTAFSPPWR